MACPALALPDRFAIPRPATQTTAAETAVT